MVRRGWLQLDVVFRYTVWGMKVCVTSYSGLELLPLQKVILLVQSLFHMILALLRRPSRWLAYYFWQWMSLKAPAGNTLRWWGSPIFRFFCGCAYLSVNKISQKGSTNQLHFCGDFHSDWRMKWFNFEKTKRETHEPLHAAWPFARWNHIALWIMAM